MARAPISLTPPAYVKTIARKTARIQARIFPNAFMASTALHLCSILLHRLLEQGQADRFTHSFVAGVARVEVIARIVGGEHAIGMGGIADGFFEVDEAIEGLAGAYPL